MISTKGLREDILDYTDPNPLTHKQWYGRITGMQNPAIDPEMTINPAARNMDPGIVNESHDPFQAPQTDGQISGIFTPMQEQQAMQAYVRQWLAQRGQLNLALPRPPSAPF